MANDGNSDGSLYRRVVGAIFLVLVWGVTLVRLIFGVGPMHDLQGNQSPLAHYVGGAAVVTAMVVAWNLLLRPRKG